MGRHFPYGLQRVDESDPDCSYEQPKFSVVLRNDWLVYSLAIDRDVTITNIDLDFSAFRYKKITIIHQLFMYYPYGVPPILNNPN